MTCLGVGNQIRELPDACDWQTLKILANMQGLTAVVLDGIEKIRQQNDSTKTDVPNKRLLAQWIGEVLHDYEYSYDIYGHAIAEMAGFYNSHGMKMMVLKGYACSLDWPRPEHRPIGDIDIWLFGEQKSADALLHKEKGVEIDGSHHHHTVFYWKDFMVENHYDFINIHHHRSHVEFERQLKELAQDDSNSITLYGEKVYLPSPNLHALFLLKHLTLHFSTGCISFRHLLDWGFFVKAHGKEVDWERIEGIYEKFGIKEIYGIFNAICVEELGFETTIFNNIQYDTTLKNRIHADIMMPHTTTQMPKNIVLRVLYKYKLWKANEWKHKLCYKESMWSAFWSGVWSHLLKPSSI